MAKSSLTAHAEKHRFRMFSAPRPIQMWHTNRFNLENARGA
jgi:hypothetical protein